MDKMFNKYKGAERRKFFRFPRKKNVCYRKVLMGEQKILAQKFCSGISKNLSTSGLLFTSKERLELSDMIALDLRYSDIPGLKSMKRNIVMLNNKPLGRVVQIGEETEGKYNIGVAFITEPEGLSVKEDWPMKLLRFRKFFLIVIVTFIIVVATLSANLIYMEKRETYHPDKNMYITPQNIGILYDDENFSAEDGQIINGWFIPAHDAKATILYCPGSRGNLCDQMARIKFFHDMKVNLMIFDYRGYGKNSGKPTEQGLYKDARAAYDFLISRKDIDKDRIVVLGESLGGAVAADLCLNRKVSALILESSIVSLATQAKRMYPFLPVELLLYERFDTLSKIKRIRIPKLIVHGLDDETVLFEEALKLYFVAPRPKQFLPFQGAHNDDIFKISDTYRDKLLKFLNDNSISPAS